MSSEKVIAAMVTLLRRGLRQTFRQAIFLISIACPETADRS
jgi:hypothetical protein